MSNETAPSAERARELRNAIQDVADELNAWADDVLEDGYVDVAARLNALATALQEALKLFSDEPDDLSIRRRK